MNVVIFGATSYAGRSILMEVLAQNHQVTILVSNSNLLCPQDKNLIIVEGSEFSRRAIRSILHNQDVVIQCLGVGDNCYCSSTSLVSFATEVIVEAMEKRNVRHLIAISNADLGNGSASQSWFFNKLILSYFAKRSKVIREDKYSMEQIIMSSKLDWTIIRCPAIVDKPAKGYCRATLDGKGFKLSITAEDMASFVASQITLNTHLKLTPLISN
ncbi:NAD(P)-dependent oxidoreductase [Flavobacterium phycosphaerae]|uniref:NAD(P)-dependent oxidoreductase n=1 Tax=Flavobacterium phycosphaerae TaxID=2697515 RepID=UPI001389F72E|nr:NAD(P)H-binding protein [Flavobacterium phycosphaerae]